MRIALNARCVPNADHAHASLASEVAFASLTQSPALWRSTRVASLDALSNHGAVRSEVPGGLFGTEVRGVCSVGGGSAW